MVCSMRSASRFSTSLELLLLHVIEQDEPKQSDHEWLREYRRILRNLLPEYAGDLLMEPVLRVEVAKNSTARILQVADEIGADLIIMDIRPEEPWATHLRDKVSEIISCASCPVLTVRTKPEHGCMARMSMIGVQRRLGPTELGPPLSVQSDLLL